MTLKPLLQMSACWTLGLLPLAAEPAAKALRHARLLAVGDSPPFRQEIRDGVRYELDPAPGSIPPREVIAGAGKQASTALGVHLGRITLPVVVPVGEGMLDLRRAADAADAAPWVQLKQPESGDFLVLLWRDRTKGTTWDHAASLVVPDGPEGAPAGTVRIINLFPLTIHLMWGAETLLLPAGKSFRRSLEPGAPMQLQILAADSTGTLQRYYSGAVTQNPGERGWVTIYRADGEASRRPLKVSMLRETVPPVASPAAGAKRH